MGARSFSAARPRSGYVFAVFPLVALAAAAACEDSRFYVYTAQRWNAEEGCLEEYGPIEVVSGAGVSAACPAACLRVGEDLYVSTLCPPLPDNATAVDAKDGECKDALAAAAKKLACGAAEAGSEAGERESGAEDGAQPDARAEEDAAGDARDAADGG
ncbi:MAG: hypothetical protein QM702_21210 [Rubrivivax sp.]